MEMEDGRSRRITTKQTNSRKVKIIQQKVDRCPKLAKDKDKGR